MSPPEDAASERDGFELAAAAGIHRMAVPTPFAVGRVNCYLIEDQPLTLVDTGPNSGKSLDELEQALAGLGHTVEDLELIVITHQHMDHLGLLEILARRSGAEVAALHLLETYLANFAENQAADDEFSQQIMRRHGIPADMVTVLGGIGSAFRAFGSRGQVTRRLHDGDVLELRQRSFSVLHRPGHSPSDTIFWDAERRILKRREPFEVGPCAKRLTAASQNDWPARRRRLLEPVDESFNQRRDHGVALAAGVALPFRG